MNSQTVTQIPQALQPFSDDNQNSRLGRAEKRLMFSAHLGPIFRKLRCGRDIEQQEVLALLPFTVPNGSRADSEASAFSAEDKDWQERVAKASALQ